MQYSKPGLIVTALWFAAMPISQAVSAPAAIVSASDLNAACMQDTGGSATCSVYIAGFSRGFYYATVGARAGYPACMPANVSEDAARTIVTDFMKSHSEMMQQGAASVVAEALISAFPCDNGPNARITAP
jgi:hypothetical protein